MDVTVRNGCMYVIPEHRVPATLPTSFVDWTSISRPDLEALLHGVTPLPAAAGSVLGWSHRVIHWGGAATELEAGPRISLAADFLHEPVNTVPDLLLDIECDEEPHRHGRA